ncbi:MAG: hypothetical protein ACYTBJ_27370 [Planctomycetota bacterium]|jgi:predicted glycosyl hydrolase (DUF1957 family)
MSLLGRTKFQQIKDAAEQYEMQMGKKPECLYVPVTFPDSVVADVEIYGIKVVFVDERTVLF